MTDLKEKESRPTGHARARIDALVHRVTAVTVRRIAAGVIEENETIASRLSARIGNVPGIFLRRHAKLRRHLHCRSSTSIFFRKQPRLKMSQPRSRLAPRRILFMRWRVSFCKNRSAITSGKKGRTQPR